jgi:predicted O-methyltransferase YrrM
VRLGVALVGAARLRGGVVVAANIVLAGDVAGGVVADVQVRNAVERRAREAVQGVVDEDLGQALLQVLALVQIPVVIPGVGKVLEGNRAP